MPTSHATCTTDMCALQRDLIVLPYHKGLWCFLGMMLYRHALAHIQMLQMTLFKPPFVDAVFPFRLFAYQSWPSLPHSAAVSPSLLPSLFLLQSPLYQVSHQLAKAPSLLFPSWILSLPSSSLHSQNFKLCCTVETNLKNASLLKAVLFHTTSAIPYTSS